MSLLSEKMEEFKQKVANPAAMKGISAIYQFILEGEGGGNYYVTFTYGKGVISEGLAENPSITLTVDVNDYIAITEGRLPAMPAFMSGKLKVKGDISLAMKLQGILG